jgi:hypothetical protein
MKSGSTAEDQARRLVEADRIVTNASGLPAGRNFILGGDFNIQSSTQAAYVSLVGSSPNYAGIFKDPIKTPGSWNNNASYRYVHTQDPAVQMDDRLDFLLLSPGLVDGTGMDYIGNPSIPYSTITWDDPNHSYRSWGNDGTSYNAVLTVDNNQMVGPTIAQALVDAANGLGHLPVFLDVKVPPKAATSTAAIDFGFVGQGQVVEKPFQVWNSGDTVLWTQAGIANLTYTMSVGSGFTVPTGPFVDAAGGATNTHFVRINTSTPGFKTATLTVLTNDVETPVRTIVLKGFVKGILPPPGH